MVHVIFDVNSPKLEHFFQRDENQKFFMQSGGFTPFMGIRYQRGYGQRGRQRGAGIGSMFRSLLRVFIPFMPVAKRAGAAVLREGLDTGSRILDNISQGATVKDAVVTESTAGLNNLTERALNRINRKQSGSGRRRPKRRRAVSRIRRRRSGRLHKYKRPKRIGDVFATI